MTGICFFLGKLNMDRQDEQDEVVLLYSVLTGVILGRL
jgi:hypothetical protein